MPATAASIALTHHALRQFDDWMIAGIPREDQ
jgi:hypothetical protein